MIVLDNINHVRVNSSSKGNQKKFYNNGYWIKLDNENCYEGLAEDFVSKFESLIVDFNFVDYKSDLFEYRDNVYNGCISYNMFNINISFISLRNLFSIGGLLCI